MLGREINECERDRERKCWGERLVILGSVRDGKK